jgi:hypothetical protein
MIARDTVSPTYAATATAPVLQEILMANSPVFCPDNARRYQWREVDTTCVDTYHGDKVPYPPLVGAAVIPDAVGENVAVPELDKVDEAVLVRVELREGDPGMVGDVDAV